MYYDKGSLVIGTFTDIPIKVHWTFGLLLLFVVYYVHQNGLELIDGLWFFSLVTFMFCFVIMHEYGHALTARRFGVDTKDIIISPIGGVARLTHIPKNALHEFYIALAGPAVNLSLLVVLLIVQLLFNYPILPSSDVINPLTHLPDYLGILLSINVALVVFNLVPAFPMDGGRILRSLLTMVLKNHQKATEIASYIGQVIAVVFVLTGAYFDHYMLLFIGIFVFLTARAERGFVTREAELSSVTARDIVRVEGYRVSELTQITGLVKDRCYLVYDENNRLLGILNSKLLNMKEYLPYESLTPYVSQHYGYVSYATPLNHLFEIMKAQQWQLVIVMDEDKKEIGVIDRLLLLQYINNIS